MNAKPILFFLIGLGTVVILSIILDFWLPLLILFTIVIGIGAAIIYYRSEPKSETRFRRDVWRPSPNFSSGFSSSPNSTPRREDRTERKLRNKIEKEWNRKSRFGNAEDLV